MQAPREKLIYVSNSVFPSMYANSVHVMKMCSAFAFNQYDVTLLAKREKKIDCDVFAKYGVSQNFDMRAFLIFKSRFMSLFVSSFVFVLFSLFRVNGGVVYSRNRHSSFILSLFKIRHIYEMHGLASNKAQYWMDGIICRSNNLSKVVVISNALKCDVVDCYNVRESKVIVAHDGADLSLIESVLDIPLKGDAKPSVGYVGSLLEGKGVELLCQASYYLNEVNFHIVGGGQEDINRLKSKFPNMINVYFYGFVDHNEVSSFIKKFDFVTLPNEKKVITKNGEDIGKYTSPLKLFEYLAFNKVIISSDLSVLKEVLGEDYAYFFKSGDVFDFVETFKRVLLSDKKLKCGRFLVEKEYSWRVRAERVIKC